MVYRKGNLLFSPDGNSVISPVGNKITIYDLKKLVYEYLNKVKSVANHLLFSIATKVRQWPLKACIISLH